jgi:hypothetical protein
MIEEKDIILSIESPLKVKDVSFKDIKVLIDKYPFCQSLHALSSKKAALEESPMTEQLIQMASAYSVDRKMLHWLHHNKEWSSSKQNSNNKSVTEVTPVENNAEKKVIPIETEIPAPDLAANLYQADFEKLKGELSSPNKEEKKLDIKPPEKKANTVLEFNFKDHQNKSLSTSEWLSLIEKKGKPAADHISKEDNSEELSEPALKLPKQDEVLKAIESINKPKTKLPVSEPLNFGMVTETLAKILIKQGQLDKAIQVYRDLSLQNPEKSAYFDAQIKNLKDQI